MRIDLVYPIHRKILDSVVFGCSHIVVIVLLLSLLVVVVVVLVLVVP